MVYSLLWVLLELYYQPKVRVFSCIRNFFVMAIGTVGLHRGNVADTSHASAQAVKAVLHTPILSSPDTSTSIMSEATPLTEGYAVSLACDMWVAPDQTYRTAGLGESGGSCMRRCLFCRCTLLKCEITGSCLASIC